MTVGGIGTDPEEIEWEDCGIFPDCAFAALGDLSLVGDKTWLAHDTLPFLHVTSSGLGMLYGKAECDFPPVEIGRRSGEIVGARMEFTDDVAELERDGVGLWRSVGRLRISSKGGVAADAKRPFDNRWQQRLPLAPAWYQAEVFDTERDHAGIRLLREARNQRPDRRVRGETAIQS